MGRSFGFELGNVTLPERSSAAEEISKLRVGQQITIKTGDYERQDKLCRSPSNYGRETSSVSAVRLVVEDIDCCSELEKIGLRAIALRDISIDEENHFNIWYMTTDGYIRECEEYGIQLVVTEITIL